MKSSQMHSPKLLKSTIWEGGGGFGSRKAGKFSSADLGETVELLFDCILQLLTNEE